MMRTPPVRLGTALPQETEDLILRTDSANATDSFDSLYRYYFACPNFPRNKYRNMIDATM